MVEEIKKISVLVLTVLKNNLESRDDDSILYENIWKLQGAKKSMTYKKFIKGLIDGEFAHPETISRARRKIQEVRKELRGKLYNVRKGFEKEFANQIKLDFDF
jgi:hypothetical protein